MQGHVDAIGKMLSATEAEGSWLVSFSYPRSYSKLLIEKGSIAIDGISLTAFNRKSEQFTVSVVPHTWKNTTLSKRRPGDSVNLEFDLLGKYVLNSQQADSNDALTIAKMRDAGF